MFTKKFYKVVSQFRNNGHIKIGMTEIEAEKKPENTFVSNELFDMYTDYLETKEEATKMLLDAQKENKRIHIERMM